MQRHPMFPASGLSRRAALVWAGLIGAGLGGRLGAAKGQEATPAATPFPTTDHPIIGVWLWDWEPWNPEPSTTYAIFNADGSFAMSDDEPSVCIGTWMATGERTVELVTICRQPNPLESFEPGFVLPTDVFSPGTTVSFRESIEVAKSGDTFSSTGYYEPRDESGAVLVHLEHDEIGGQQITGTRLVPVSQSTEATPTP